MPAPRQGRYLGLYANLDIDDQTLLRFATALVKGGEAVVGGFAKAFDFVAGLDTLPTTIDALVPVVMTAFTRQFKGVSGYGATKKDVPKHLVDLEALSQTTCRETVAIKDRAGRFVDILAAAALPGGEDAVREAKSSMGHAERTSSRWIGFLVLLAAAWDRAKQPGQTELASLLQRARNGSI